MSFGPRILVLDSYGKSRQLLSSILELKGYSVCCTDNPLFEHQIREENPEIVVYCISGFKQDDVHRFNNIRKSNDDISFFVLDGRITQLRSNDVELLLYPFDEYLIMPVDIDTVLETIWSCLKRRFYNMQRRSSSLSEDFDIDIVCCGDLVLNRGTRKLRIGENEFSLRPMLFDAIDELLKAKGSVISHQKLSELVRGRRTDIDNSKEFTKKIASLIRNVLNCNCKNIPMLETVQGVGYRLIPPFQKD